MGDAFLVTSGVMVQVSYMELRNHTLISVDGVRTAADYGR
jgi:hypothetical protein